MTKQKAAVTYKKTAPADTVGGRGLTAWERRHAEKGSGTQSTGVVPKHLAA